MFFCDFFQLREAECAFLFAGEEEERGGGGTERFQRGGGWRHGGRRGKREFVKTHEEAVAKAPGFILLQI